MARGRAFIGTSGWNYKHWRGPFYPPGLPARRYLEFYKNYLNAVEINRTFYSLPAPGVFDEWKKTVPPDFLFSIKASRFLTHMKRLSDPRRPLARLMKLTRRLGSKEGPLLFQLPPRWRRNAGRLADFLSIFPRNRRAAFEFRDPSWFHDEIYALLRRYNAAFCVYELAGVSSPKAVTANFVYLRLHGPAARKYQGDYSAAALKSWARWLTAHRSLGRDAYCFFDNDDSGFAVRNARALRELMPR
jgi:uncharacterized protein YecE (DUF72 family)